VAGLWQRGMIGLARSGRLRRWIQRRGSFQTLARRFVAGDGLTALRESIERLEQAGLRASVYYLGEYVESPDLVEANTQAMLEVIRFFEASGRRSFLSVDPTQIGYSISDELGLRQALRLRDAFSKSRGLRFLMIDMEDASYVDRSLALHDRLKAEGLPAAITLQAYLRRTEQDLARLADHGAAIRLCKGAFVAPDGIAWTKRPEIDAAFLRLARRLLSPAAKGAGAYPILATHDEHMIERLLVELRNGGWCEGEYEFEMLLGVREDLACRLAQAGHAVRVYVPFGTDWWPYAVRRIGENSRNLRFVFRALSSRVQGARGPSA
jgi:proline dehydrogenase